MYRSFTFRIGHGRNMAQPYQLFPCWNSASLVTELGMRLFELVSIRPRLDTMLYCSSSSTILERCHVVSFSLPCCWRYFSPVLSQSMAKRRLNLARAWGTTRSRCCNMLVSTACLFPVLESQCSWAYWSGLHLQKIVMFTPAFIVVVFSVGHC